MKNYGVFTHAFVFLGLITLSGCTWKYYEVQSTFHLNKLKNIKSEITKTSEYRKLIRGVKKIAVRAPEQCANESQSSSKGLGSGAVVLKQQCGQEMAQIEKSLAKSGYRVISWKVVQSMTRVQKKSALDVAKSLGAQLLLQINSLERTSIKPGKDARWDRKYFVRSIEDRDVYEPTALPKQYKGPILKFVRQRESNALGAARLSASLNATVAAIKTGEAIWFYDWTVSEDTADASKRTLSIHTACKKRTCKPWHANAAEVLEDDSTGSSSAVSTSVYSDEERAVHDRLIKKIIKDMVKNLKV